MSHHFLSRSGYFSLHTSVNKRATSSETGCLWVHYNVGCIMHICDVRMEISRFRLLFQKAELLLNNS